MSLLGELRRRNVIRVGILYAVGAWLLLQLADVLSSLLPVPSWTGSLVVVLLALGFFPALVFAWVFELTPEGLKREKDLDRSQSISNAAEHRTNTLIIVLLIIAIGIVAVDRLIPEKTPPGVDDMDPPVVASEIGRNDDVIDAASIAVLPFADLSQAQDQRFFTDGISEELLNVLVRVEGLHVASRTSSFGYRDTSLNVSTIGEELKVRHVLEGSVRKDMDRIRITAQLIDASTDKHLWSDTYDRELRDIFRIQDEIANAIVNALIDELGIEQNTDTLRVTAATENLDAYELYLKARDLFHRRASIGLSLELYEQAVALDPTFARAWDELAGAYSVANSWIGDDVDYMPDALRAARKAIELDPTLSLSYAVLGLSPSIPWVESFRYFDLALVNEPNNITALLWRGTTLRDAGFMDKDTKDLVRCLEIDPLYLNCKQHLALHFAAKGDDQTALRLFEESVLADFRGNDPNFVAAYLRNGQRQQAILLASSLFPWSSQAPVSVWIDALENPDGDQAARLERFDQWSAESGVDFDWIAALLIPLKAYDRLNPDQDWIFEVAWLPEAREYRQSDHFQRLVREEGVLAYWQSEGFPPQCEPVGEDGFRCD